MTVEELLTVATENSWKDPDRTIAASEEILLLDDSVDVTAKGAAMYFAGEACYVKGDVDGTIHYITGALSCLEESQEYVLMAKAANLMAITAMASGNAMTAMEYYLEALEVARKTDEKELENMILINVGNMYLNYSDFRMAESYFKESIEFMTNHKLVDNEAFYYFSDYLGLGNCALYKGDIESAMRCERLLNEYVRQVENAGADLCFLAFKARLCHLLGEDAKRDNVIASFHKKLRADLPLLDYFDDFYDYAKLLLAIGKEEEFCTIVDMLDELAERANIVKLRRKVTSLRIKYHKKNGDDEEYNREIEKFYRQTLSMESANRTMMVSLMTTRTELEKERRLHEKERAEKERLESEKREMTRRAETDGLTGIHNRAKFNEYAPIAYTKSLMAGRAFGIEILDIDYFKQFNDNYGHQMGDLCIITVASVLASLEKTEGVSVYRYGGDEFIVMYEGLESQAVRVIGEHLKAVVESHHMPHEFSPASDHVTISQGICVDSPRPDITVWDFLKCADNALYDVKKTSRNAMVLTGYVHQNMS